MNSTRNPPRVTVLGAGFARPSAIRELRRGDARGPRALVARCPGWAGGCGSAGRPGLGHGLVPRCGRGRHAQAGAGRRDHARGWGCAGRACYSAARARIQP